MGTNTWGEWARKYLLNIDTFLVLCVLCLVLYFIYYRKKKKYKFRGLGGWNPATGEVDDSYYEKSRKQKKKRKIGGNKHEEECRKIFQKLFQKKFKSIRPDWLSNPVTGKNLELDGYCPDIVTPLGEGLAFEYDGQQHAKHTKAFHKSEDEFTYQVKKDHWKNAKCKEKGIVLIRIPYYVSFFELEKYIKSELDRNRITYHKQTQTFGNIYG
jgi:hypothetical protein